MGALFAVMGLALPISGARAQLLPMWPDTPAHRGQFMAELMKAFEREVEQQAMRRLFGGGAVGPLLACETPPSALDQIRSEVGDDPEAWIPIYHQRRKGL